MIVFIGTSVTSSRNHIYYNAMADLHNLQFTVAHAPGFSVSTSRLLATGLNTGTVTSNHFEDFLLLCLQSRPNLYSINQHNSLRTRSILVLDL
jgi:hypothetical protein